MDDQRRTPARGRRAPIDTVSRGDTGAWSKISRVLVAILVLLVVVRFAVLPALERHGGPVGSDPAEFVDRLARLLSGEPPSEPVTESLSQRLLRLPIEDVPATVAQFPAGAINVAYGGMTPIMTAASAGRADLIEVLIALGGDPDGRGSHERTALQYAAERNRIEVARVLLAAGADVNGFDTSRLTPLVMAADRGYTELAFVLLDAGADVNIAHAEGWTALIDAARAGNLELVKRLIYDGADLNLKTPNGWRAVDYARHYKHAEIVRVLERAG